MQTLPTQVIGCIGKCTSGFNREELDQITDNIHRTLSHPRGREIFRRYLERRQLTDNIECLALYETCNQFLEEGKSDSPSRKVPPLELLINHVTKVKEMAEDLDGVPEIDWALLRSFTQALDSQSRTDLLCVLEDTKDKCRNHLKSVHGSFKKYVSEPCPLTK
ncbi:uncharacterized protein LOC116430491 [Nomia melanderi]|uniref:uncharacterized protein LOC116430491 n=1 Tax=Nomia melanderi TaxID=2448451 RepID=UPI00130428E1|nr:uncharacterized protein LOC116430491 [Nomia melanderi]XP_031840588.1 uncharacterized protein LOC116430491 [Nomia melanderi]XP_031840589.1 uncharacterized protein LOC116430491 [Nomia melanderi]